MGVTAEHNLSIHISQSGDMRQRSAKEGAALHLLKPKCRVILRYRFAKKNQRHACNLRHRCQPFQRFLRHMWCSGGIPVVVDAVDPCAVVIAMHGHCREFLKQFCGMNHVERTGKAVPQIDGQLRRFAVRSASTVARASALPWMSNRTASLILPQAASRPNRKSL